MSARVPTLVAVAALVASPVVVACGGGSEAASGSAVTVTAKDDSCAVSDSSLAAGKTTFAVSNKGSKVTELYLYGEDGGAFTKVVEEVENIGPGTSRDLSTDLKAGTYEIACKPGQTGDGIRTRIQVTGSGGGDAEQATTARSRSSRRTARSRGSTASPARSARRSSSGWRTRARQCMSF